MCLPSLNFAWSGHIYGAFAAGRNFCSLIITKNFKLTLSYELIHGLYRIVPVADLVIYIDFRVNKFAKNAIFGPILTH